MKKPFKNTLFANSFHGILALVLVCLASSCTSLQSGQSFIGEYGGITYRYEVIVSYHNYVRVTPVSGPEAVVGAITLPSTVRYNEQNYVVSQIGANAFCGYNGITSVNIPATVSVIESAAFRNCQSMTTVDVPTSVSTIGDYAFENCSQLQSFYFPNSLSTLGQGCFSGCTSLDNIALPSTISSIPENAFYGCSSVTSLQLPSTILQIGDRAFAYCSNLDNIYFDRSVQTIGDSVFMGCGSVHAITCLTATPPACTPSTFGTIPANIPVTVMMSSLTNYQNATGWDRFTNYVGTY